MKNYICKYAKFICGIGVKDDRQDLVEKLNKDFGYYYHIKEVYDISSCDARIYIVDDAYEGTVESEEICIHSSHSKNVKYLLEGSKYTQQDASIYAKVKNEEDSLYYYIEKTQTKVLAKLAKKTIYLSGSDLYVMFVYVYETLLSISIEHKGGIQLHGACCQWDKKGYIITGKSGGGKTTLMFNILKKGGLFHSNDRVAVYIEDNGIIAYSIPIPVNVPIDMMRSIDGWKDKKVVKNAKDNTKIRFMVSQLGYIFKDKMVQTTKIDKIIVVNYSQTEPEYEKIEAGNLKDYLEILSPYDENHPKWLPIFDYPNEDMVETKVKELREKLTVCKISGRDTYNTFFREN